MIAALLAHPHGMVFLYFITAAALLLIIWFCWKVVPRIKSFGKGGIHLNDPNKFNPDVIKGIFDAEFDKFIFLRDKVKQDIKDKIENEQKKEIQTVITNLCLNFSQLVDTTEEENIDVQHKILKLFLERDLSNILLSNLNSIKSSVSVLNSSEVELINEIQKTTIDCVNSMKNTIFDYVLISENVLQELFENSESILKNAIDSSIGNFKKSNKSEQEQIIKLEQERISLINKRLEDLLGKDSKLENKGS